jgi:hypothetical protein
MQELQILFFGRSDLRRAFVIFKIQIEFEFLTFLGWGTYNIAICKRFFKEIYPKIYQKSYF